MANVKFELEGVKPVGNTINLKVVLRNQQTVPLNLGNHGTAVIRMNGAPDRQVKVSFAGKSVPPGGVVHGFIRIPGHSLSPASDLYMPKLLPGESGDVHLTVPISAL
jgi:hypothetical protein